MHWTSLDTAICLTGARGHVLRTSRAWLMLRRHSMMGDALSHSALPGVVMAFLGAAWLQSFGVISAAQHDSLLHLLLFLGAVVVGIGTAWLTEWVQRLGRMESGAALGVVFTSVFALGLLLIRLFADQVHIDPDCVLFGILETSAIEVVPGTALPQAALTNGIILCVNLLLTVVLFKELRISAFDAGLATTLGIPARGIHYGLMAATALTVVAAFETVGSILVIGLLIVPAATALLLSERLQMVLLLSLIVAAGSALLGHVLARTVPGMVFPRLGFPEVRDAGTAGMMSVTAGLLFILAMFLAPRQGLIAKALYRIQLALRISADDVLGLMYRLEESDARQASDGPVAHSVAELSGSQHWMGPFAVRRLLRLQLVAKDSTGLLQLTDQGREAARSLIPRIGCGSPTWPGISNSPKITCMKRRIGLSTTSTPTSRSV